jgi:hypothetical protein
MGEASVDLNKAYGSVEEKIKANKTYIQVQKDAAKLKKRLKNNLEKDKKKVTTTVNKLKDKKKKYQRQVKNQLDHMLEMVQFSTGSGSSSMKYIKNKFIEAAVKVGPRIFETILKESIHSLGCSQQQAYDCTKTIYIKVKSTDIQNLLKRDPTEEVAAIAYEKIDPITGNVPYSMNKEMWKRLQNTGVATDFIGASGKKLFDISYVTLNPITSIPGDYYKIQMSCDHTKVGNFLTDYYKAIQIIDTNNLFAQLMDQLCGAVSFEAKLGYGELEDKNKFLLLLQRILGLCFDSKQEIDISGNGKVAELDGVDQSFFEFTDIDLRYIDDTISNIQNGVVEFEDCGDIKLPVNSRDVLDSLLKFNDAKSLKEEIQLANNFTNILSQNPTWPTSLNLDLSLDLSFLKDLPQAIMMALLSPKVLLPLLIMSEVIGQNIADKVKDLKTFIENFKKYTINIMSKIGALFVEELFNIIKKDIKNLISQILLDIKKEKILKKYSIILVLVELILIVARFVNDWRKCKSVVDEILALLNLVTSGFGGGIPSPLLAASELLDGYSPSRAFINVIEEYQKIGLPTGDMPDGSPNLMLQAKFAELKGQDREQAQNGKIQLFAKPLTVTPAGVTLPAGNLYGKSY